MSNAKFTTGPWLLDDRGYIMGNERAICRPCTVVQNDVERDANTNLIAAAPDMYKALKSIAEYKYDPLVFPTSAMINNYYEEIARAALKKANP